jgi:hypothetical protein
MWMGQKFPAVLLNHLHAQTNSAGLCTVMFEDKLFLPWTFVMQGTKKLLVHMLARNSTNILPSWQKLNQYASFTIPLYNSHGLTDWGQCFWPLLLAQCCVMPFQTLLFCFWIKVMKLVFITRHDAAKKVTTFNSILFQQM